MAKVTFNGTDLTITVNSGVTSVDVESELYSEWKRWAQTGDNAKYKQAFRTFGGDDTVSSQTAPKYFFLMNGWKIVVDGQQVSFATNLYQDGGGEPFMTLNGGGYSNKLSDSPTVGFEDIPSDVWNYVSRELTVAAGLTPEQEAQLDNILSEVQSIDCGGTTTNEWVVSI